MKDPERTDQEIDRTHRRYSMADRKSLLFSAVLLIAGEVVYQVAELFHPEGGRTANDVFTSYANSAPWTFVHEAQFAGSAMVLFGLLALFVALGVTSGIGGLVSRFAAASAVAALALNGALYGVDGVGLKQAIDAWVGAPASAQSSFFVVVQGIRGVEWGIRSYVDFTTGLSLVLLAMVIIASTARIKRPIGYLMGLSGLAYIAQGYGYGTGYTALSNFVTWMPSSLNYQFLIVVWAIWLLVSAWRRKESVQAAPA
jgi:hypothetical protein